MNMVEAPPVADAKIELDDLGHVTTCPTCGAGKTRLFYEVEDVPTNSCILFDTRADAVGCDKGSIALRFCETCGFIYNSAFRQDLTEYSGRY